MIMKDQRSSSSELFFGKGVLKTCSKFTREHPDRSAISTKLQSNFIEIVLRHGCSPVNLPHIFRTTFSKNTSGWLLLEIATNMSYIQYLLQIYRIYRIYFNF